MVPHLIQSCDCTVLVPHAYLIPIAQNDLLYKPLPLSPYCTYTTVDTHSSLVKTKAELTVGTYSWGNLFVVYEMSRQVLPTAPSPTTTHLMVCIVRDSNRATKVRNYGVHEWLSVDYVGWIHRQLSLSFTWQDGWVVIPTRLKITRTIALLANRENGGAP